MEDKLLKLLHDEQMITDEQYQQVVQECEHSSAQAEAVLQQFGILSEEKIVEFLSKKFRMPAVNWDEYTVDEELLQLVPEHLAMKYIVFPYALERGKRGGKMTLAVADPSNVSAIDEISFRTGCIVKTAVASTRAIQQAIQQYYREAEAAPGEPKVATPQQRLRRREKLPITRIEEFDALLPRLLAPGELAEEEADVLATLDRDHPSTKFFLDVLDIAVTRGISEIHIEPYGQEYRIRFRVHGSLHQHTVVPGPVGRGIASSLRKIAHRADTPALLKKGTPSWIGSFWTSHIQGTFLTVLVHFYPTPYGEKMLLKMTSASSLMPLEQLGIEEKLLKTLNRTLAKSEGLVLLVSPPGQGKTTTLYSIIQQFARSDMHILTIEHPVEIWMPAIHQIFFNPHMSYREWYSFISYHAPNLLALENIESTLMAQLAFELASSTLVLASVTALDLAEGLCSFISLLHAALRHAQDAGGGNQRQKIEPLLLDSINGIVSQRLVRTLCSHCKTKVPMSDQDADLIRWLTGEKEEADFPVYTGKGCNECMSTGYSGQTGIFEITKLDKHLKQFLLQELPVSSFQLRQFLADQRRADLRQQGLQKLRDGMTSPEEIRRVMLQPAM